VPSAEVSRDQTHALVPSAEVSSDQIVLPMRRLEQWLGDDDPEQVVLTPGNLDPKYLYDHSDPSFGSAASALPLSASRYGSLMCRPPPTFGARRARDNTEVAESGATIRTKFMRDTIHTSNGCAPECLRLVKKEKCPDVQYPSRCGPCCKSAMSGSAMRMQAALQAAYVKFRTSLCKPCFIPTFDIVLAFTMTTRVVPGSRDTTPANNRTLFARMPIGSGQTVDERGMYMSGMFCFKELQMIGARQPFI
jgi:hypothetical protein